MKLSPRFFAAAMVASAVALSSCSRPPLKGQVFVVTQGAGSYKLGLAPIYLLDEAQAEQVRSSYSDAKERLLSKRKKTLAAAEAARETAKQEQANASAAEQEATKKVDKACEALCAYTKQPYQNGGSLPSGAVLHLSAEAATKMALAKFVSLFQTDGGYYSPALEDALPKELRDRLMRQLDEYRKAGATGKTPEQVATEMRGTVMAYYQAWADLSGAYDQAVQNHSGSLGALGDAAKELEAAASAVRAAQGSLKLSAQDQFAMVPAAFMGIEPAAKTDGDGNFVATLPKGAKYVASFATRKVGDSEERYFWALDLESAMPKDTGAPLILSNDNTSDPDRSLGSM